MLRAGAPRTDNGCPENRLAQRIGEILLSDGRISERTLTRALDLQQRGARGTRLGAILLKWEMLGESELLEALSRRHQCPSVDWNALSSAAPETASLLSPAQAARLGALPYAVENGGIRVAFVNPSNLAAVDEVQAITGRRVRPAVTTEVRMMQAQQRFYARPLAREVWSVIQKLERKRRAATADGPAEKTSRAPEDDPKTPSIRENSPPDLSEIAESLLPMLDTWDEANHTSSGTVSPQVLPVPLLADARPPDPLKDDASLSEFVGEALQYYKAQMDLDAALAALSTDDVEDVPAAEAEPASQPSDLDSTHPSRGSGGKKDARLPS